MSLLEKMNNLKNVFVFVTALAGAFGVIYGGISFVDSRYALAEEVKKIEKRLTLAELKELLRQALEELYFYRSQARKYPEDEEIKKRLKEAQEEVDDIKAQIKELTKPKEES